MHIDRPVLNMAMSPDMIKQLDAAEHLPRPFEQQGEDLKFLRAEVDSLTAAFNNLAGRKQLQVLKFKHIIEQGRTDRRRTAHPRDSSRGENGFEI